MNLHKIERRSAFTGGHKDVVSKFASAVAGGFECYDGLSEKTPNNTPRPPKEGVNIKILNRHIENEDTRSSQTSMTYDSTSGSSDDSTTFPEPSKSHPTQATHARRKDAVKRNVSKKSNEKSILILGASGRLGSECIQQFAESQNPPTIFGLCRNIKTVSEENMELCRKHCEGLIVGDATRAVDLYRAIQISHASTIIICIGGEDSTASTGGGLNLKNRKSNKKSYQTSVRTACAMALVKVLVHPPFHHIRLVVISASGVNDSLPPTSAAASLACFVPSGSAQAACILPGGLQSQNSSKSRRYALQDHTGQEDVLTRSKSIRERTTIVRPTLLMDDSPKTRKIATFKNNHKPPSFKTSRRDLARWLVTETSYHIHEGKAVNVTSV